jgi:hypothetical protein
LDRKINLIEGPFAERARRNCYSYMIKIVRRNIKQGKYPTTDKKDKAV